MTTRVAALAGAAVIVAAVGWAILTYNRLVQLQLAVDAQWGQVEAQYQRRVDLLPNLVAAVRVTLGQERTVFQDLTRAREAYLSSPPGSPERVRAANALERPLGQLLAVVEAYPQLRSADAVARLMDELAGTENRIAVERRRYNERVQRYDTLVQQFPASLIAAAAHFSPRPYFSAVPASREAPPVTLPAR